MRQKITQYSSFSTFHSRARSDGDSAIARAGFTTEAVPAKAHDRAKRAAHVIYLARRAEAALAAPATGRPPKK